MDKAAGKTITQLKDKLYRAIDEGTCEHKIMSISSELDEYLIEPSRRQMLKAMRQRAKCADK